MNNKTQKMINKIYFIAAIVAGLSISTTMNYTVSSAYAADSVNSASTSEEVSLLKNDDTVNKDAEAKELSKTAKKDRFFNFSFKKDNKKAIKDSEKSVAEDPIEPNIQKEEIKNTKSVEEVKKTSKAETAKKTESATVDKKKWNVFNKDKKDDYSDYLMPTDGYMPVGNMQDKSVQITGSVQKSLELNLADCLELALINNPRIKAAYAGASVAKAQKNITLSNYSPQVDIKGGISRIKPDMSSFSGAGFQTIDPFTKYLLGTIGIKQLVYDFGTTQNQYTIDKMNWEAKKSNIDSVVNDVVCQVKDGYYYLLYAISKKQVAEETVAQYEQMYQQAKAFYEVGVKAKVDLTIAASNLANARANLIEAENGVDLAISKVNNAMGLPFVTPYIVDTSLPYQDVSLSMKEAVEIANESRPDLKISLLEMKQADQYVKLSKKTYFPTLSFEGNVSSGGRDSFTDVSWYDFGGYLSFPTINPFLIRNQIVEAKAMYEQQQYNTKATVNDIYYEIQQAYTQLVDARERIPAVKLSVKEAKESYQLSQGRYRVGVCDAIELRDAQVQYANAKLSYVNTLYQYNSARAYLEKAIGQTLKPSSNVEKIEI